MSHIWQVRTRHNSPVRLNRRNKHKMPQDTMFSCPTWEAICFLISQPWGLFGWVCIEFSHILWKNLSWKNQADIYCLLLNQEHKDLWISKTTCSCVLTFKNLWFCCFVLAGCLCLYVEILVLALRCFSGMLWAVVFVCSYSGGANCLIG